MPSVESCSVNTRWAVRGVHACVVPTGRSFNLTGGFEATNEVSMGAGAIGGSRVTTQNVSAACETAGALRSMASVRDRVYATAMRPTPRPGILQSPTTSRET